MPNFEEYHLMRNKQPDDDYILTGLDRFFLQGMLELPESRVFLSEKEINEIRKIAQKEDLRIKRLGEASEVSCWKDTGYIAKAAQLIEIFKKDKDFSYANTSVTGKQFVGRGGPLYIEVDCLSHKWYINFVDVRSKEPVLASLERMEITEIHKENLLSREEREKIRETRRNRSLTVQVCNNKGAFERAAALFSDYKRTVKFDRESECLIFTVFYCDYEEELIFSILFNLGLNAQIMEPDEVIQKWKNRIDSVLNIYSEQ